jgi:hypothetical protein
MRNSGAGEAEESAKRELVLMGEARCMEHPEEEREEFLTRALLELSERAEPVE